LFKKKQVLVVISIAITCFLIGTMFDVMASESAGNPWDQIWTSINELESKVETLEEQLSQQGFLTAPAYDSGWICLQQYMPKILTHNLDTTNVFVYITDSEGTSIWFTRTMVHWVIESANAMSVQVNYDTTVKFRVQIWKISEP
jgi:hypothetical protein